MRHTDHALWCSTACKFSESHFCTCSEPEVQILDGLAKDFKPHIWMNMHSGMEALFMPYDHVAALPDDPAGVISYQLLKLLNSQKCGGRCAIGSGGKSVGASLKALTLRPLSARMHGTYFL